jgi:predicted transcriptional regulator
MTAKTLFIGIRNRSERISSLRAAMRRVAQGDRTSTPPVLYFENIEDLRRILTDRRVELLATINRERPASVHALAALVKRDYKNVSTDLELLERLGLISFESQAGKGRAQKPVVPYDEIQVTIDLRHTSSAQTEPR